MHYEIGNMVGYNSGKGQVGYPPDIRPGDPSSLPLLVTPGGHWKPVQTCSFGNLLLKLNYITYNFQAGAMHPTGMRSC